MAAPDLNMQALRGYMKENLPELMSGTRELKATKIDGGQVRSLATVAM
jgi:hypothetical protein